MGFQKCGTTALYNHLAELSFIDQAERKEIDVLAEKGAKLSQFLYYFPKKENGKTTINASHQMLFVPEGINNFQKYFPAPQKIVLILRNPIKRAISHFFYDQQIGLLNKDEDVQAFFEEAVRNSRGYIHSKDIELIYEKSCTYSYYGNPISRSLYLPYILELEKRGYKPHIIMSEDYKENPKTELQSLFNYLGWDIEAEKPSVDRYNDGKAKKEVPSAVIESLEALFRPCIQELEEHLGKKTNW